MSEVLPWVLSALALVLLFVLCLVALMRAERSDVPQVITTILTCWRK